MRIVVPLLNKLPNRHSIVPDPVMQEFRARGIPGTYAMPTLTHRESFPNLPLADPHLEDTEP
jgi:hypothetical protein